LIYRSPFPDLEIPPVSLPDLILARARTRREAVALIDGPTGAELTYGELAERVDATAAALIAAGFGRQQVAALCLPNCVEFAIAFLAVARAGGAATTVNPSFTEDEMRKQLADSGAVAAFTTRVLMPRVEAAAGARLRAAWTPEDVRALPPATPPAAAIDPDDVVALPYSSGTTGTPKGVMLTHRNLVAMQVLMEPVERTGPHDVVIAVLPFFHIYGLSVILLLGLYRGARLVIFPRFDMESFLAAVERYRVTRLPLVPPLILRLAQEPRLDDFDLSSVRTVISGAAPLAPEVAARLSARLGGCLVKQGYGMTELSPGGHMHAEDGSTPPPGSVGLLHPNTECRVVDPATGADVAPGETGEIWYRGPQVMKGYLGKPEETASMITPDGWLRTGDLGRVDEQGQLHVVDRLKELIKYKGFQVAPAELEALLLTHPAVADVAVIPKPDAGAGEIPKAFVVVAAGAETAPDELLAFVAERVAGYKRVRAIEFVEVIPKSPSGKILRRVLLERERERLGAAG
jgi:acyl-CoA synthetase (AMP-forming)/AMP-acid ligase II